MPEITVPIKAADHTNLQDSVIASTQCEPREYLCPHCKQQHTIAFAMHFEKAPQVMVLELKYPAIPGTALRAPQPHKLSIPQMITVNQEPYTVCSTIHFETNHWLAHVRCGQQVYLCNDSHIMNLGTDFPTSQPCLVFLQHTPNRASTQCI